MKTNSYSEVSRHKQKQMLKLVTNSFYRELVNYGVDKSDIVTVSVNLLDLITDTSSTPQNGNGSYRDLYKISSIVDEWNTDRTLSLEAVSIKPLQKNQVQTIAKWLTADMVQKTLISFFPTEPPELTSYLLERPDSAYFGIYYKGSRFVGIIGAEHIDQACLKLEMKKFIGEEKFRGKGIGKMATFLFLYYTFRILNYNKVYIHSLDTNINNINLNSKFGFELEGIFYKEFLLNKVYRDVLRMGLLKDKWIAIFSEDPEFTETS